MLVLPPAVALTVRHSPRSTAAHSLCLAAFKRIIPWEMPVSSKAPYTDTLVWEERRVPQPRRCCRTGSKRQVQPRRAAGKPKHVEVLLYLLNWTAPLRSTASQYAGQDTSSHWQNTLQCREKAGNKVCLPQCLPRKRLWASHDLV